MFTLKCTQFTIFIIFGQKFEKFKNLKIAKNKHPQKIIKWLHSETKYP